MSQQGEEIEFVVIHGLADDGMVYEWFRTPGEWRPFVYTPRGNDAF